MKELFNRFKSFIKRCNGITLVEIIVVLAILAILAAIIVPSLIGYIDSSKRKICETNRLTLLRHYKTYLILEPDYSLGEFLEDNKEGCPSGGTYTVAISEHTHEETLICSVHGALKTNTPSVTVTPGVTTTIQPTPGLKLIPSTDVTVNSEWPNASEFFGNSGESIAYNIYFGQTFYYEGQYYIVTVDYVDLYLNNGIPTPTNGQWIGNGNIVKINNRVIQWDGGTTEDFNVVYKNNLPQAGDICYCKVDGIYNYYVFTLNNQYWVDPPNHIMTNWVKLDSTYVNP